MVTVAFSILSSATKTHTSFGITLMHHKILRCRCHKEAGISNRHYFCEVPRQQRIMQPSPHTWIVISTLTMEKRVREKSRECHNHKPQPFPDPKRKRKPTNPNKHKSNKRIISNKISSLFPKRGNRNTKRTDKHKNKMTHGKTYNKSPRRINHKATKSKTNTGTTALERSVE